MGQDIEKIIRVTFFVGTKHIDSASMNRFLCIAKATSNQLPVRVVGIRPTQKVRELEQKVSEIDKNPFFLKQRKSKGNKTINKFISKIRIYRVIYKFLKRTKDPEYDEVFYIRVRQTIDHLIFFFFKKRFEAKLVIERNEYPKNYFQNNHLKWFLERNLIMPWSHRLFDGMIVITQTLFNFYTPYLSKKSVCEIIPMTVDPERFKFSKKPDTLFKEDYLFYSGSLVEKKDGVETLVKSFQILQNAIPDINLIIAGGSQKEVTQLKRKYNTDDQKIMFLGTIPSNDIPGWIYNAKALLLPRPHSIQAEGGFPTKLGEYLISGNPVIATPVGEIPKYLSDKRDVYFVNELNPENLSNVIRNVLESEKGAKEIGEQGKETALKNFSYLAHQVKLKKFLSEV